MTPISDVRCELGEGAFWHPERGEFLWVDILGKTLHSVQRSWQFEEMVSAMAWVDAARLLVASETRLFTFDLDSGQLDTLCPLEDDNAQTRSNDGRADPQGGFWIGTMGKSAEAGAGSIWRWYGGELRKLYPGISIPNAISFAPDGKSACFTDTPTRRIMRVALDADGWPQGTPECWLDLNEAGLNPDGAVFDADGNFWLALWGAGGVATYAASGARLSQIDLPAAHTTCPAFGGAGLDTLYCTSAREGRATPTDMDGATFAGPASARGQAEHRVRL
jgi:sugar lactone lactonase YvrE